MWENDNGLLEEWCRENDIKTSTPLEDIDDYGLDQSFVWDDDLHDSIMVGEQEEDELPIEFFEEMVKDDKIDEPHIDLEAEMEIIKKNKIEFASACIEIVKKQMRLARGQCFELLMRTKLEDSKAAEIFINQITNKKNTEK